MSMPTHKSNSRGRLHSSTDADQCDLDVPSQEVQILSLTNNLGNLFILGTVGFICGHLHHTMEVKGGYLSTLLIKVTLSLKLHTIISIIHMWPHKVHHSTLYLGLTCDVLI